MNPHVSPVVTAPPTTWRFARVLRGKHGGSSRRDFRAWDDRELRRGRRARVPLRRPGVGRRVRDGSDGGRPGFGPVRRRRIRPSPIPPVPVNLRPTRSQPAPTAGSSTICGTASPAQAQPADYRWSRSEPCLATEVRRRRADTSTGPMIRFGMRAIRSRVGLLRRWRRSRPFLTTFDCCVDRVRLQVDRSSQCSS